MNIFAIDKDPIQSAQWMVDKHVVKMILETAQLLSTAHRLLDGTQYIDKTKTGRNVKRWRLPDERETVLYSATHINHPSAVWCRETSDNYKWLYRHFLALCMEYKHRYGKVHKCMDMCDHLCSYPRYIKLGDLTPVTPAMPDEYKVPNDSVASYRNYYRVAKARMHKWTKRDAPEWIFQS
jgi:Pyrimidine dimer DNA glycosylase